VLKLVGGAPVIIKLIEGTQGIGVVLGETESSAKSVIEAFRGANVNILVQEFVQEAQGTDIRAFVVGGRVVAAIQRTGLPTISAPTSTRRLRQGGAHQQGGARHRPARRPHHGPQRMRRRPAALQGRPGGR
jgi:hypothetical protein